MSTVLDAPVESAPASPQHEATARPTRSIVWALARVEGRRLILSPLFVLCAVAALAAFVVVTWRNAPTLQLDSILIAGSLLPMAGATFLVANLAAFRSERHETEELYEGLVATRGERTIGHLASVAWAMAAAAVVVLVEGAYLLVLRPVGPPNVFEVTTGLATVGLMGALGILLGRYVRSAVAAPVALVALASVWALISLHTEQASTPYKWLTPWVLAPTNPELLVRPAALHLLYLVSLITLVGAVAILRDGRRRARAIAIAAAMAVMVCGWAVTRPPSDAARAAIARLVQEPARFEECATLEGVRYCAYPGYRGWIGRWNAVIRSTLAPVPADARPRGLVVEQVMGDVFNSDLAESVARRFALGKGEVDVGDAVTPGVLWGNAEWEGGFQLGLGLQVAAHALGYPTGSPFDSAGSCRTEGQAKAVVAIWLAAQATAGSGAALRAANATDPWGVTLERSHSGGGSSSVGYSYTGPDSFTLQSLVYSATGGGLIGWGTKEATYAGQLLAKPHDQVAGVVAAHWKELTDASTPTARLVELFGLRPLPTLRQQLEQTGTSQSVIRQQIHSFVSGNRACP